MNLVLFGMQCCGKTKFGKMIAKKISKAFIDTDELIEDLYQINRGQKLSCRQIFKEVGPMGFRLLEHEVIQSLQDVQNSVIAVGGGAMTRMENAQPLSKTSHFVYLIVEKQTLKKRVLSDEIPSYLDPKDPESSFDALYDERDSRFRKLRATELDVTNMKDDEVLSQLIDIYEKKVKKTHGK